MARNANETSGGLRESRYVLHDRDTKFRAAFDYVLNAEASTVCDPAAQPNLLHCLECGET
jgi:hypothetical protein